MIVQDPMLEIFIFETQQLLETLEDLLLEGEKQHRLTDEQVNEIFRIMHTIKGSSAMMSYDSLAKIAHAVEDMFSNIRDKKARSGDWDNIFDIVLGAADLIKADIALIQQGQLPVSESSDIVERIHIYLGLISKRVEKPKEEDGDGGEGEAFADPDAPYYKLRIAFEPDCQMESMRAFGAVNALAGCYLRIAHIPSDLMADSASEEIAANGFTAYLQSNENPDDIKEIINGIMFLDSFSLINIASDNEEIPEKIRIQKPENEVREASAAALPAADITAKQNFISVNVNKLDKLLDLVGEIVTTESMVTKNPEVIKLQIEGFERAGQQMQKLINELQDIVMSIRMLPVSTTFHKMQRIVRDMSKKVNKQVELVIIGEETEVDKNVIDTLSDPLMHLIRNAIDHGLEPTEEREALGKPTVGKVVLEAQNSGGDVMVMVRDDGRGLDRSAIIAKAIDKGLTTKPESEISDKEAFSMVFLPGFSTKEAVTEFSGRGVGMDVVKRNIDKVGGTISVESEKNEGTTIQIKIPLTLAIIEGMKLRVGKLLFVVPMLSIQESFKPNMQDAFLDPDGRELIMIRGECYPIFRLHDIFDIQPECRELEDGILIMIRTEADAFCLFVDELIGEQQAVVKPLPAYIQKHNVGLRGIGGCAILGDGSISLIIDINNLLL